MSLTAILTPVYLSPEFPSRLELFEQTVRSVRALDSNGDHHLHVVIDDGSEEPEGIHRVLTRYGSPATRYLRRERRKADLVTASNALNLGIDAVLDGDERLPEALEIDRVTPLHSDDLIYDTASRLTALEPADVGAALGAILRLHEDGREELEEPSDDLTVRRCLEEGVEPYPVASIMWKRKTLEEMRRFNREGLPAGLRFDGVYLPGLINLEDVAVVKLTVACLAAAGLRLEATTEVAAAYRFHPHSLRGYHQDEARGKTEEDLWHTNARTMRAMYYPS